MLRYVEPETSFIREDLITFLECDSGTTSEALADQLILGVRGCVCGISSSTLMIPQVCVAS